MTARVSGGVVVVVPVFDDWSSCARLVHDLVAISSGSPLEGRLSMLVVDDGSLLPSDAFEADVATVRDACAVSIVRLPTNLGHQRALAMGLRTVSDGLAPDDVVVTMDADGEDRPGDVVRLVERLRSGGAGVVVARRGQRSESLTFRVLYACYRVVFRLLTGHTLAYGNFIAFDATSVRRLVPRTSLDVHLAATTDRYVRQRAEVVCDRGTRYAGRSQMNRRALMLHAFSAVSIWGDVVALRLAGGAFLTFCSALLALVVTIGLRAVTDLAIPGWASTVGLGLLALAFQSLVIAVTSLLLFMNTTGISTSARQSQRATDRTGDRVRRV